MYYYMFYNLFYILFSGIFSYLRGILMVTFTKDEIISSTVVSRSFSSILNKLKEHKLEKIGVLRNNEMEVIILPVQEYELMQSLLEQDEYKNIYSSIKEREQTPIEDYISFESILSDVNKSHERV